MKIKPTIETLLTLSGILITCWSIRATNGLITTPMAVALVARGGINIHIVLPPPVGIFTRTSCLCNTRRMASSCPGLKLSWPKYECMAGNNFTKTGHEPSLAVETAPVSLLKGQVGSQAVILQLLQDFSFNCQNSKIAESCNHIMAHGPGRPRPRCSASHRHWLATVVCRRARNTPLISLKCELTTSDMQRTYVFTGQWGSAAGIPHTCTCTCVFNPSSLYTSPLSLYIHTM